MTAKRVFELFYTEDRDIETKECNWGDLMDEIHLSIGNADFYRY